MTDTDRELLELAAKAAGFDTIIEMYGLNDIGEPLLDANDPPTVWNPLTDDGDALRLAVILQMRAVIDEVWVTERTSIAEWERDPLAATRRAITRAAAEIGKAMP